MPRRVPALAIIMTSIRPTLAAAAGLLLLAGCRGDQATGDAAAGDVGGTLVISAGADAAALMPALITSEVSLQISDLVFDRLAEPPASLNTFGDEGFTPRLARAWRWSPDSLSIAFELHPEARWHDDRPVTAHDVRFTYEAYSDPRTGSPIGSLLARIDSVTVADSLTAVFWFRERYLEQFFEATYHMRIMPAHLLGHMPREELKTAAFGRHPIGSGRYRFARWRAGSIIELVADTTNYRGRPKLDRLIWTVAPDPSATTTQLFTGAVDFLPYIAPTAIGDLAKHPEVTPVRMPALQHGFLGFNLTQGGNAARPHRLFGDRDLRRALSMAVDRDRIVASVFDTLGKVSRGPLPSALAAADTTVPQIPYDVDAARRALDSLGWLVTSRDSIRRRSGQPLRFSIITPTSSAPRRRVAVLLQEQLRLVGAQVDIEPLEFNAVNERINSGNFDAVLWVFVYDPSPSSIRQGWNATGTPDRNGSNYTRYASAEFDAAVDSATGGRDPAAARQHFRRALEIIVADAPAIWLYEPAIVAGLHERVQPTGMRADAWWAGIGEWTIPAERRTARDRVGLASATRDSAP